jgi:hypothetical protein
VTPRDSSTQTNRPFAPRALLVATVFGLVASAIVLAGLTIPIGGTDIVTDPREIFTTLGAALTGPAGGVIVGVLAGLPEPNGIPLAGVLAHVAGGFWMGVSYKKLVYERFEVPALLAGWAVLVVAYYFVFLVPGFVIGVRVFYGQAFTTVFDEATSLAGAYMALARGAVPEVVLTTVFTTLVVLALPRKYRRPLW